MLTPREYEYEWKGKTYEFVPNMKLIKSIEKNDISLVGIMMAASKGQPQTSLMAEIMFKVMSSSGAPVSEEELYQAITYDMDGAVALYHEIIVALSPPAPDKKKAADTPPDAE